MSRASTAAPAPTAAREARFVFQQSNLLPSLTATEQLEMITHLNGGKVRESRRRARGLLSSLGLEGQLDRGRTSSPVGSDSG